MANGEVRSSAAPAGSLFANHTAWHAYRPAMAQGLGQQCISSFNQFQVNWSDCRTLRTETLFLQCGFQPSLCSHKQRRGSSRVGTSTTAPFNIKHGELEGLPDTLTPRWTQSRYRNSWFFFFFFVCISSATLLLGVTLRNAAKLPVFKVLGSKGQKLGEVRRLGGGWGKTRWWNGGEENGLKER